MSVGLRSPSQTISIICRNCSTLKEPVRVSPRVFGKACSCLPVTRGRSGAGLNQVGHQCSREFDIDGFAGVCEFDVFHGVNDFPGAT